MVDCLAEVFLERDLLLPRGRHYWLHPEFVYLKDCIVAIATLRKLLKNHRRQVLVVDGCLRGKLVSSVGCVGLDHVEGDDAVSINVSGMQLGDVAISVSVRNNYIISSHFDDRYKHYVSSALSVTDLILERTCIESLRHGLRILRLNIDRMALWELNSLICLQVI